MRDTIKIEKVYKEDIEWNKGVILRFKNKFDINKDIDKETEERWNQAIFDYSFNLIYMHYSIGNDIKVIEPIFLETIEYMIKIWEDNGYGIYTDEQYSTLVTMLSLAVLLDVDHKYAIKLMKSRAVVAYEDTVLDFLLKSLITEEEFDKYSINFRENGWQGGVIGEEPYSYIQELLELKNKKEQEKYLKNQYLKNWYKNCKNIAWHNRHKKNIRHYYGYWSFESVAITKILGLDDSSYRDNKYYPKDMLNWRENE